jgi:hypothetical protein
MDYGHKIKEYLCIYDINAKDIDRYGVFFLGIEEPPKLMILEDPNEYKYYKTFGKFKDFDNVICSAWLSIKKLQKLLKENNIKYLLIDAHRIPDVHIIIAAKKLGIKILYIQHGMYIPYMKRQWILFIKKIIKSFRYFYYAFNSAIEIKDFSLLKKLIDIHIKGKERKIIKNYDIFPDRAAVFSNYWKEWHSKYYFFKENNMFIMGTSDFRKFKFGPKLNDEYVAYCYQSLLEDGRISKKNMFNFYDSLKDWAKKHNKKIVVKVHPVADKRILELLKNKYSFELEYQLVPNTEIVIGHYSSLLPFWGIHNRKVVCIKLPGHEIDNSIADWSMVVNSLEEIKDINNIKVDTKLCKYYFDFPIPIEELREKFFKE